MMEIRDLACINLKNLTNCFNEAFADYIIPYKVTGDYLRKRFQGARVDYSLSYGAFEQDMLVGFIIQGIDMLYGVKTAFNMATGVIPEFRGRRIVEKVYNHAAPILKDKGVVQCRLEVICSNEKAVKAYKKSGFSILKNLQCFAGEIHSECGNSQNYEFRKSAKINLEKYSPLSLYEYSWENTNKGLELFKDVYEAWELFDKGNLAGYVLINPKSGYIPQFGTLKSQADKYVPLLFSKISGLITSVKINNIDFSEKELIDMLLDAGLKRTISQYEMGMFI